MWQKVFVSVALSVDCRTLAVGLVGVGGEMEPVRDADGGCGVMCGEQGGWPGY